MTRRVEDALRDCVAASYARQSQFDAEGIDAQHVTNVEFGGKHGLTIPIGASFRFGDDNVKGDRLKSPDFDRLKQIVSEGAPFRYLIVRHCDRFGRWAGNLKQFITETHWFEQHGVRVLFADDPSPEPLTEGADADDIRAVREFMKAWMAGQEIKVFKERTRFRRRLLALAGYWVSSQCPYGTERWYVGAGGPTDYVRACERDMPSHVKGYRTSLRWATDGSKEIVREIFDGMLAGHSAWALAIRFNERKLPPPRYKAWSKRYDNTATKWTVASVYAIVHNPVYCGAVVYGVGRKARGGYRRRLMLGLEPHTIEVSGKGPLLVRNAIPDPPIDEATWVAVQRLIMGDHDTPPRRRPSRESLLGGHVRCAYCHRNLWVQFDKRHSPSPRYLLHYSTKRLGRPACPGAGTGLSIPPLEDAVKSTVTDLLGRSREIGDLVLSNIRGLIAHRIDESVEQVSGPAHVQLQRLEDRVSGLLQQLAELPPEGVAYEQAKALISRMDTEASAVKARLRHVEALRSQWESAAARLTDFVGQSSALADMFRTAPHEEQRNILRAVTEPLIVDLHTGEVELRFKLFRS